jgi:hypothetical protein
MVLIIQVMLSKIVQLLVNNEMERFERKLSVWYHLGT